MKGEPELGTAQWVDALLECQLEAALEEQLEWMCRRNGALENENEEGNDDTENDDGTDEDDTEDGCDGDQ